MSQYVVVSYGTDREYEVTVADADTAPMSKEQARDWLAGAFERLECAPGDVPGKRLVFDMILDIARAGGEDHFKQVTEWSRQFATAVAAVLGRPVITVDVANNVVR